MLWLLGLKVRATEEASRGGGPSEEGPGGPDRSKDSLEDSLLEEPIPETVTVITGWGRHSKRTGNSEVVYLFGWSVFNSEVSGARHGHIWRPYRIGGRIEFSSDEMA